MICSTLAKTVPGIARIQLSALPEKLI